MEAKGEGYKQTNNNKIISEIILLQIDRYKLEVSDR